MTQQRLSHCLILHVHREKTDNLNHTEVAQEFIERNDRQKRFFWKVLLSTIELIECKGE